MLRFCRMWFVCRASPGADYFFRPPPWFYSFPTDAGTKNAACGRLSGYGLIRRLLSARYSPPAQEKSKTFSRSVSWLSVHPQCAPSQKNSVAMRLRHGYSGGAVQDFHLIPGVLLRLYSVCVNDIPFYASASIC